MKVTLLLLAAFGATLAVPVKTGNSVIDVTGTESRPSYPARPMADYELLDNPGFETGALEPWTSPVWVVDTVFPQGGEYCAADVGNYWIQQLTDTVAGPEVISVTFWARQPDQPAAQAYDFLYGDGGFEEFVHFPMPDWRQFDVTAQLNRGRNLVGIRIWGYSGGGPGPDSTYIDDVSISVQGTGIAGPSQPGEGFPVRPSVGRSFRLIGRLAASVRDGCGRVVGMMTQAAPFWPVTDARPGVYFAECGKARVRLVLVK